MAERRGCAHVGCREPAVDGGEMCPVHGGHIVRGEGERWTLEREGVPRLPTLDEEIARLARQRDRMEQWLERRTEDGEIQMVEVLRCLMVLSQMGRNLAVLMLRRQGNGNEELEKFLEDVTREARNLTGDTFTGSGFTPGDRAARRKPAFLVPHPRPLVGVGAWSLH